MCAVVGLVIAARVKTMEDFQVIMNFPMPMFFLSGALFPLGNLPDWLTVLTRINPARFGVDAIRRIILVNGGVPADVVDQLGISLFGNHLNAGLDLALLAVFAAVIIVLAMRAFEILD
jgi:ABC-2 type transport system permease protein